MRRSHNARRVIALEGGKAVLKIKAVVVLTGVSKSLTGVSKSLTGVSKSLTGVSKSLTGVSKSLTGVSKDAKAFPLLEGEVV